MALTASSESNGVRVDINQLENTQFNKKFVNPTGVFQRSLNGSVWADIGPTFNFTPRSGDEFLVDIVANYLDTAVSNGSTYHYRFKMDLPVESVIVN